MFKVLKKLNCLNRFIIILSPIGFLGITHNTHSLSILSLHVHEVCGVEAAVHALLVPRDSTFHGGATWSRTKDELLEIGHVD